jgi:broad specificity phosphatase PhoE
MAAKIILVMRHAEKSDDPLDPDLSPAGRARAQHLASYIPATFGQPGFLFASAVSKHSHRPIQTLEPLSLQCSVKIDASYADQDYGALAQELRENNAYDASLVIVCWHHGNIPPLMHALKAAAGDYPDPWNPAVFNLILRLDGSAPKVTRVTEPF